jgi:hypothetical protein
LIAQRAQLTFSLVDSSDSIGNMSVWLADGVDLDAAVAAGATFRGLVAPCTDAVFVRQSVVYSAVVSPRPIAPTGADSSRVGGLIFSCDTGELDIIELHGIKDEMLMTTGPGAGLLIDRTNTAIVALVNELISGLWCNPFGYDVLALESAYLQIRR